MPLMSSIDSAVVMRRLQATGWSLEESRHLWGLLGGYCNSLIGMPQVLTQAIVMSLVPAIAAGYKVKNFKEVADNSRFGMRMYDSFRQSGRLHLEYFFAAFAQSQSFRSKRMRVNRSRQLVGCLFPVFRQDELQFKSAVCVFRQAAFRESR